MSSATMASTAASSAASLAIGDVLRFHRGGYSHLGLYAGHRAVIHLWSPTGDGAFAVRIDHLRFVQRRTADAPGQRLQRYEQDEDDEGEGVERYTDELDARMHRIHGVEPFAPEEIVRRARSRLGETRYDYLSYNCEHFVTWARYGHGASPQATSHTQDVLAGALLGAAVGGMAGLVVGGVISLLTKVQALSVSSAGVDGGGEDDEAIWMLSDPIAVHDESVEVDEEVRQEGHRSSREEEEEDEAEEAQQQQQRRQRREVRRRLLEDISAIDLADDGSLDEFEAWATARHEERLANAARPYSEDRHQALATRLADDKLLCGICFYDLQLTRALAFPCDHFTCAKCHDALVSNLDGYKCCPYCRMHILDTEIIHRSTKLAAKHRLQSDAGPLVATHQS